MSSNPHQPRANREVVFCHSCENEWYRDEHGIICPECQGDFCEVIEPDNDPRPEPSPDDPRDFYAPDPDEDDIDNFRFQPNAPGQPPGGRYQGTFHRNFTYTPGQGFQDAGAPGGGGGGGVGGAGGLAGGLFGMLAPALQGIFGGQQQQQHQGQGDGQEGQQRQSGQEGEQGAPQGQRSPSPQEGQQQPGVRTFMRSGPNYSFSITTSSNANMHPRNANQPQPIQGQPVPLERMMAQMFSNIGIAPGHGGMRGGPIFMGGGPLMMMDDDDMPMPHGGHMGGAAIHLGPLLQMLGMPPGGVHGDAVYSQEALDRIISQLMDQHQSGHAPGPASAEAIEKLPKRPVTEKDQEGGGKANCSICMDEVELASTVTELPCSHWFHHDCIKAWLTEHDTCPHCRQGIMPKEGDGSNQPRQPSQAPLHDMHSPEYQRSRVPGEYPFPPQAAASGPSGSGDGSRAANPFAVPETHDSRRSASPRAERSGGMFSRMREAFSPREQPPSGGPSGSNDEQRNDR